MSDSVWRDIKIKENLEIASSFYYFFVNVQLVLLENYILLYSLLKVQMIFSNITTMLCFQAYATIIYDKFKRVSVLVLCRKHKVGQIFRCSLGFNEFCGENLFSFSVSIAEEGTAINQNFRFLVQWTILNTEIAS